MDKELMCGRGEVEGTYWEVRKEGEQGSECNIWEKNKNKEYCNKTKIAPKKQNKLKLLLYNYTFFILYFPNLKKFTLLCKKLVKLFYKIVSNPYDRRYNRNDVVFKVLTNYLQIRKASEEYGDIVNVV